MNTEEKNWRQGFYPFKWMFKCIFLLSGVVVRWKKSLEFKWMFRCIFLICVPLCFISCHTIHTFFKKKSVIPKNLSVYKTGAFSGAFVIEQKSKKKYFSGDIFLSDTGYIRLDLSVSLGFPILALLLDDKQNMTALFLKTKEYYKGRGFLPGFLPPGLNFLEFQEVFFDRIPKNPDWKCAFNDKKLPIECHNSTWTISWGRGDKRTLTLKSSDFHLIFNYLSFDPEVDQSMFHLKVPDNFKAIFVLK